jgi:hypothetical protein
MRELLKSGANMLQQKIRVFLRQEDGFVISSELLLFGTIVVIGLLAGLSEIRDSVLLEFDDFSKAIGFLDQTFSYGGVTDGSATTEGGLFLDSVDEGDNIVILVDPPMMPPEGET